MTLGVAGRGLSAARRLEAGADEFDEVVQLRVVPVLELALDLVDGVDDGGVVTAAEARADLRQRGLGEIARQVHGDLARVGDLLRAAVAAQVVDVQAELPRDLGLHRSTVTGCW